MTEVIRDPSEKEVEAYRVVCDGRLCSPSFESKGAAKAYKDMIDNGSRKPEFAD